VNRRDALLLALLAAFVIAFVVAVTIDPGGPWEPVY
jgi:hypothetical protein